MGENNIHKWDIVPLRKLSTIPISNGIFNDPKKVGRGYRLVNVVNLYDEPYINSEKLKLLDASPVELEKFRLAQGDLLFTRSSLNLEGIAHCNMFVSKNADTMFECHTMRVRPNQEIVSPDYLYYFCRSGVAMRYFMRHAQTTTMTTIGQRGIGNLPVHLPPLPEQKAIADILQTWDAGIEKTEALIAAKERQFGWLRYNTIQNAINTTPAHFGDLLTESRVVDKQNDVHKRLTVRLHLKGVDVRDSRGTESEGKTQYYVRRAGQLIYGKQNIFRGSIGIVPKELDGYCSSQDIPAFDIAENVHADWLFWYMSRPAFYEKLEHYSTGTGSKRFHPRELFKLTINVPAFSEQKRIANVLNVAQNEIALLKQTIDAYRIQKRGLMQKLLTGEWRVQS